MKHFHENLFKWFRVLFTQLTFHFSGAIRSERLLFIECDDVDVVGKRLVCFMRVQAEKFEVYCSTTVTEFHVSFLVKGIAHAKYRECILNYPKFDLF